MSLLNTESKTVKKGDKVCLSLPTFLLVVFSVRDANIDHDVDRIRHIQVEVSGSHLPVFSRY